MKALIIVPPYTAKPVSYYNLPMGLLYVATAIRSAYDEVEILNFNEVDFRDHDRVIKYKIQDVDDVYTGGLSVHYNLIKQIVDTVRKCDHDVRIVVGGGLVTSQPEMILELIDVDEFVLGEVEQYKNVVFDIKRLIVTSDILDITLPSYDLFNMELYLSLQRPSDSIYRAVVDNPRDTAVIASRGCPYQCTFCFHPTGNVYRQRSLDSVFKEIEMLKENYNINILSVYDECFATKKDRLIEFCDRIRKLKLNWSCQLRVDSVDLDMLRMMKGSGCYIISFGIESASNKILRNFKKNITVKQINNALEWSKKAGIVVQGNIILGAEEETIETVEESLKWWSEHKEYNLSVGPVIPYPGTSMYKNAVAAGKIDPVKFLEDGCPAINCAKESFNGYDKLIAKYVDQTLTKAYDFAYESELDFFGRVKLQFKIKCPYCGHEQVKNNFAMDMVEGGIKYCEKCAMRYFIKKG